MFTDVLCAIDGGPGGFAAVEQAAALAHPGTRLTLLLVTSHRSEGQYRSPAIGPIAAKRALEEARAIAGRAGIRADGEVDPDTPPAKVILDWAARRDLLALGAPDTQLFGAMLALGAADTAMDALTAPVLIARPSDMDPFAGRIVVASDGREGSDELVDFAAGLASVHRAELTLVHAVGHETRARQERAEAQAESLSARGLRTGEPCVAPGAARNVITELARELDASLIVMSSRRLWGVRLIGSVSRPVAHGAHCSVLLVPPERLMAGRRR